MNKLYSGKKTNLIDYTIIILLIITSFGLANVLLEYYNVINVFDKYFILISMFLGFFIIKDVVHNVSFEELNEFLFSIVLINSFAAALYFIHQGLHVNIYNSALEYQTEIVNGQIITRTFWFMPPLLLFSIAYLLVYRNKNESIAYALIALNLLAVFITYTRSFLINALILFMIFFLLFGMKKKSIWLALRGFAIIGIAGVGLFVGVSTFLPTNTGYFLSRFEDLGNQPVDKHSNNLIYRFFKTENVFSKMNTNKALYGYGPVTNSQNSFVKVVNIASVDMVWAELLFRWGLIGTFLFIFLYGYSFYSAVRLYIQGDDLIAPLALVIALTIATQFIDGFTSMTILTSNRIPLSLWCFGILSALMITTRKSGLII